MGLHEGRREPQERFAVAETFTKPLLMLSVFTTTPQALAFLLDPYPFFLQNRKDSLSAALKFIGYS